MFKFKIKMKVILSLLFYTFCILSHPIQVASTESLSRDNPIYFDWTVLINTLLHNDEGHVPPIPASPQHIFYSTDIMVSNLTPGLSPVFDLLDRTKLSENPVYISFPIMDGEFLSGDRFGDLLLTAAVISSAPPDKLESFKKHVSGIFLDLRIPDCPQQYLPRGTHRTTSYIDYQRHTQLKYDLEWDISFTKYMKRIFGKLIESKKESLKVGVIYDDTQSFCFKIAQQIKQADFIVINVNFTMEWKFPLTNRQFSSYLERVEADHKKNFLREVVPDINKVKISFKVNLVPPSSADISYFFYFSNTDEIAGAKELLKMNQHAFFSQLLQFARQWVKEGKPELILGQDMNMSATWETWGIEGEAEAEVKDVPSVAYLHVQEVDITPCQLRTMLGQTASQFASLVVSEYTWSAFAGYADEMTDKDCPKSPNFPVNPPNIDLLFTSGAGKMWDKAEAHFRMLLQDPKGILGWRLDHLIFPGVDTGGLISGRGDGCSSENETRTVDAAVPKFAMEMKDSYKIGCLVELNEYITYTGSVDGRPSMTEFYRNTTIQSCEGLWNLTSLIIWQFEEEWERYDNFGMKSNLFKALIARESFAKEFPEKEIVLKINVLNIYSKSLWQRNNLKTYANRVEYCQKLFDELHDYYKGVQTWGRIHKVRVISTPAYHIQEPVKGKWTLPEEDGTPTEYFMDRCYHTIDH